MIAQGLPEQAMSQLRFLRAANAIPDTDLGAMCKMALEWDDRRLDAKQREQESRMLQLFVNADLYREVYRDELDAKPNQLTEEQVQQVDMQKLSQMMAPYMQGGD